MMSEWMKVMLEEIERKLEDAAQAQIECTRRQEEASKKVRTEQPGAQ